MKKHMSRRFRRFLRANEAVSALEYAILVGVIAVAVSAAIATFGGKISDTIAALGSGITANPTTPITTTTPTPP